MLLEIAFQWKFNFKIQLNNEIIKNWYSTNTEKPKYILLYVEVDLASDLTPPFPLFWLDSPLSHCFDLTLPFPLFRLDSSPFQLFWLDSPPSHCSSPSHCKFDSAPSQYFDLTLPFPLFWLDSPLIQLPFLVPLDFCIYPPEFRFLALFGPGKIYCTIFLPIINSLIII